MDPVLPHITSTLTSLSDARGVIDSKDGVQQPGSKSAPLERSAIPMIRIKEENRKVIEDLIKDVPNPKLLVLDSSLAGPIGLFIEASELKQWGVEQWYQLNDNIIDTSKIEPTVSPTGVVTPLTVIVITRPSPNSMEHIALQIRSGVKLGHHRYIIGFIPRQTEESMLLFVKQLGSDLEGMFSNGDIQIVSCPIYFFPLDTDLLSLEIAGVYRDFHTHSDSTPLISCAEGLMQLQVALKGLISRIWSVGSAGKFICDQLLRYRRELQMQLPSQTPGQLSTTSSNDPMSLTTTDPPALPPIHVYVPLIEPSVPDSSENDISFSPPSPFDKFADSVDHLILFDRRVDRITPFCSPFSYEALLDQHFGLHHTFLNANKVDSSSSVTKSKVSLHSGDPVFAEIRNLPQHEVGKVLHAKSTEIQKFHQEREGLKTISEMSQYMKVLKVKMKEQSSLELHVNLKAEMDVLLKSNEFNEKYQLENDIMLSGGGLSVGSFMSDLQESIEDLVELHNGPSEVYRLLCLMSAVGGGIKPKFLDLMQKILVETYGLPEVIRLHWLERGGLLIPQEATKNRWKELRELLQLILPKDTTSQSGPFAPKSNARNIAYVCAGYTPLTVRLIQLLYHKPSGWKDFGKIFDLLWGPTIEARQSLLSEINQKSSETESLVFGKKKESRPDSYNEPLVTLVFFIGGCTYAEVAAIRHLNELLSEQRKFVIVTTEMLNYKKLLDSFRP